MTREQYATLLPKSVTTAISMDVAAELGGIAALTGAIVILTGIAGNLLAESVCKWFHITDPIAKGVASAPQPMPWAPARPSRWAKWRVP